MVSVHCATLLEHVAVMRTSSSFSQYAFLSDLVDLTDPEVDFYSLLFEFSYHLSISAKFWQNPASIDGEEENKFCQKLA